MTPFLFAGLAVAGGVGAAARFLVDGLIRARFGSRLPWGTLVINVSGSLLLGMLTGLTRCGHLAPSWQLILGTGLLGGYTTFSTASLETVRLLQQRRPAAALVNGLGMLVLAVAAAALGYLIAAAV